VSDESIAALRENLLPILVEQARARAASLAQVAGWRVGDVLSASNLRISTSIAVQFSAE
jgi:hypothetical protein